ncbi:carboxymuconolactone decarboxylase family protein [soil metagenome]
MVKPIYLADVEKNPKPGAYNDLITASKAAGREHWPIWSLFAFNPETTSHLMRFTQGVMHDAAPISPGLRELIAAYVSALNQCEFCLKCHAAVASELLGSEQLVAGVIADVETSALPENEKALMRFVRKVTLELSDSRESDILELKTHGWSDEAIYYAIMACALFNFYNRWITASGVHAVSQESHTNYGKLLAQRGYDASKRFAGMPPQN